MNQAKIKIVILTFKRRDTRTDKGFAKQPQARWEARNQKENTMTTDIFSRFKNHYVEAPLVLTLKKKTVCLLSRRAKTFSNAYVYQPFVILSVAVSTNHNMFCFRNIN